nr:MAG TPA: hypothetical protein [Caudoviricetes sp.]
MHTYTLNCMSLNCTSIFTYITYISDISMHRKRSHAYLYFKLYVFKLYVHFYIHNIHI